MKKSSRSARAANNQLFSLAIIALVVVGAVILYVSANANKSYDMRSSANTGKGIPPSIATGIFASPSILPAPSTPPPGKNVIWIFQPAAGAILNKGNIYVLQAATLDVTYNRIVFSVNGEDICTITASPYGCLWTVPTGIPEGNAQLTATSYTRTGEIKGSDTIDIQIIYLQPKGR